MILSNAEILSAIDAGHIIIDPHLDVPTTENPNSPLNTTSIDLKLGDVISIPNEGQPYTFDLRAGNIAQFMTNNYTKQTIDPNGGYALETQKFVLANTRETIKLPIKSGESCYAARVEGKSSYARCGLMIHFTAPTIHAGFEGTITLELINLGYNSITLFPDMYICQLIFEKVEGEIWEAPSQFQGQTTPEGV